MTPERPNVPAILLVVDDDPHTRELEQVILEPAGYQVFRVSSGPAAIALLERGRPLDLLIADLSMPEMDGTEMVRRIRTTRPDLKVLYVTGHIELLKDAQPFGKHEAFLEKPFSYHGLREAVSLLLYGTMTKPTGEPTKQCPHCGSPMRLDKRVRPETGSLFMGNDRWICFSANCNYVEEIPGALA